MQQLFGGNYGAGPGLEVGQVSRPWNVPGIGDQANPVTAEVGATGTPIFSGFLRELGEYNPNLTWPSAYMVYEQMRRGDAMVAATLSAIKLPIRCAEWRMQVPDTATAIEKEAAKFCESCLFDELDFKGTVLENALLQLDFGASMHEDVWYVDGNASRIRLKKLAPRLPLTWFRWLTKPGTDELDVVEQLGYRAGQYVRTDVPIDKCALFTYRQEGANFTGRSLLREMYPHWYTKWNIYKIDAISIERNGMGVPVITMGDGGRGRGEVEDRKNALSWVQQLTVHERTGLVLPPGGWNFKLEGVTGTLRDPKDAIQHHNTMIALAGLAQFLMMGQGQHSSGNRALGQTMSDFFFLSLQAVANQIARVMSLSTIKRLVDLNFDGIVNYPRLDAQQILAVNFQDVMEALKDVAAASVDLVRPDDDLEAWVRQKIGAPKAGEARLRVSAPLPAFGTEAGEPAAPAPPAKGKKQAAQVAASEKVMREPQGIEKCLAASEIVGALDKGRDDVAAALRAARPRIQAEIVHKVLNRPLGEMHRANVAPDEKLHGQVAGILEGVRAFGQEQVGQERARQLAGKGTPDAAQVRVAAAEKRNADPVGLYADGVVSEFTNTLSARATNAAINRKRKGGTDGEVIQSVNADLADQSDKWIDAVAGEGANEAFAAGRQDGFDSFADEIDRYIYSAMLDFNCCGNCAAADGSEGQLDELPGVPNEDCDGGDRCRCVLVAVFKDEVTSAS